MTPVLTTPWPTEARHAGRDAGDLDLLVGRRVLGLLGLLRIIRRLRWIRHGIRYSEVSGDAGNDELNRLEPEMRLAVARPRRIPCKTSPSGRVSPGAPSCLGSRAIV